MTKLINTGLPLRRRHESDYSALRRFLVANRFETHGELMAICDKLGVKQRTFSGRSRLAYIPEAILKWEDLTGIDFPFAPRFAPRRTTGLFNHAVPLRNCPVCAGQCFHSELYQFEWVSRCPLHQVPIITSCPSCKQPWPKPSELLRRHCSCCSAQLSLATLAASGAFSQPLDETAFNTMEALIYQYKPVPGISVFSHYGGENQYRIHYTLPATHLSWPSLISHNQSDLTAAFETFGADIIPVAEKTFALDPISLRSDFALTSKIYLETLIINEFEADLCIRLKTQFGENAIKAYAAFDFESFSKEEIIATCFRYWRVVIHSAANGRDPLYYCDGHSVFKQMIGIPSAPCLMNRAGNGFYETYSIPADLSLFAYPGCLPSEIQKWLCQCDLWWTFVTMYRSIERYAFFLKEIRIHGHAVACNNAGHLQAWQWNQPRYLILRGEDDRLTIRVPEWLTRVSLEELD